MRLAMTDSFSVLAVAFSKEWVAKRVLGALATVGDWIASALLQQPVAVTNFQAMAATCRDTSPVVQRPAIPYLASVNEVLSAARMPLTTRSRDTASGQSLDALLKTRSPMTGLRLTKTKGFDQ